MLDFGVAHGKQVLHYLSRCFAVHRADHVQNLASADEGVGGIGIRGVDGLARLCLIEQKVVLQKDNKAMAELAWIERGILGELQN